MSLHVKIRWVVALAMVVTLFVERVFACDCGSVTICQLVEAADVAFLGQVISGGLNPGEDPWSGRPRSATLRIIEAYKGLPPNVREVSVALGYLPGMCSPAVYRLGEHTLAFPKRNTDGTLSDGACSGSRFAKDTPGDLQYVRDYFAGLTKTTIRGQIAANTSAELASFVLESSDGTPVAGAQVTAVGNGRTFSTQTDDRGAYVLEGLPAGAYRVGASKPGYSPRDPDEPSLTSFPIRVQSRGCAIQDLGLWSRNSVRGIVSDASGKPVAGLSVFLQKIGGDMDSYGEEARTNARGEFQFQRIDQRPSYLVVSPFGARARSPYDPQFYGGAATRDRAKPINVEATSNLQGMNIVLGPRLATRTIRIELLWPEGTPVKDAFIRCGHSGMKDRSNFDVAEGSSCTALADRDYHIYVQRIQTLMPLKDTPEPVVPAGKEATTVTIRVGPQDSAAARRAP